MNKANECLTDCEGCPASLLCVTDKLHSHFRCMCCKKLFVKPNDNVRRVPGVTATGFVFSDFETTPMRTITIGERECLLRNTWKQVASDLNLKDKPEGYGMCDGCKDMERKRNISYDAAVMEHTLSMMDNHRAMRNAEQQYKSMGDSVDTFFGKYSDVTYFDGYAKRDAKATSTFWRRMKKSVKGWWKK